jgi:hypothetical protein
MLTEFFGWKMEILEKACPLFGVDVSLAYKNVLRVLGGQLSPFLY